MIEQSLEFQVEVLNGIQEHFGRRISTESWLKRKLDSIQADRFAGFFIAHKAIGLQTQEKIQKRYNPYLPRCETY